MTLPHDPLERARWRRFVIACWLSSRDLRHSCFQAVCLGMPMTRADYLAILRAYVDANDETRFIRRTSQ